MNRIMLKQDFEVIAPSNHEIHDDDLQSSWMWQHSSFCILRPKPEPTDSHPSAVSSSGTAIGAFPDHQKNDQLDFKAHYISDRSLKTVQGALVSPSDESRRWVIRVVTAPSVSERDQRAHVCNYCGKSFSRADILRIHLRSVHRNRHPHLREYCEKSFSQQSNLQSHVDSVHLNQRSHNCVYCEKRFTRKFHLQTHVNSVHLKQRPYTCELCGKSFVVKDCMRRHFKFVHLKERPHKCKHCEKTFPLMSKLRIHEKSVHLKLRPYACTQCSKSFALKGNMRKHLESVHSNKPAGAKTCSPS
ncbi:unnamed protein product [Dicrocoelium dendriticum]|nr:unnamed protein product [Dicrocoelium dendriticum]